MLHDVTKFDFVLGEQFGHDGERSQTRQIVQDKDDAESGLGSDSDSTSACRARTKFAHSNTIPHLSSLMGAPRRRNPGLSVLTKTAPGVRNAQKHLPPVKTLYNSSCSLRVITLTRSSVRFRQNIYMDLK